MMDKTLADFGIHPKVSSGQTKMFCPNCHDQRKHKHDKSLSVNISKGTWNCHNPGCGFKGDLKKINEANKSREKFQVPENISAYSKKFLDYFKTRLISESSLLSQYVYERNDCWMPSNKNSTVAHFPVFRDAEVVNVKMRSLDVKEFMQKSKEKHGAIPSMIGLQNIKNHDHVVIVEGEIDMLTYIECSTEDHKIQPISVPQGAPNPASKNYQKEFEYMDKYTLDLLRKIKYIYLSLDDDEPGSVCMKEIAKRLGKERCRVVNYPPGCKDINDVLKEHGKKEVLKCLSEAKPFPVRGLIRVAHVSSDIDEIRDKGFERGLLTGNNKVDRYISLKKKLLYILTGVPGSGKTTWLDWYLTEMIRHNPNEHVHVAYYTPENRPISRAMAKIAEKYVQKRFYKDDPNSMSNEEWNRAKYWIDKHFTFINPSTKEKNMALYGKKLSVPNALDSILMYARLSVEQYGSNVLVLDPWNKLEHQIGRGDTETNYISRSLDVIMAFADYYDVSVFLIAHPSKMKKAEVLGNYQVPGLGDISGSANWFNKADVGIVAHRDKFWIPENSKRPAFNYNAPTDIYLQKHKFEEVGEEGMFRQWMDKHRGGVFVNHPDDRMKIDQKKLKAKQKASQTIIEMEEGSNNEAENELPFTPIDVPDDDLPF